MWAKPSRLIEEYLSTPGLFTESGDLKLIIEEPVTKCMALRYMTPKDNRFAAFVCGVDCHELKSGKFFITTNAPSIYGYSFPGIVREYLSILSADTENRFYNRELKEEARCLVLMDDALECGFCETTEVSYDDNGHRRETTFFDEKKWEAYQLTDEQIKDLCGKYDPREQQADEA